MDLLSNTLLHSLKLSSTYALFEDSKSIDNKANNLFFCHPQEEIIVHNYDEISGALARIESLKKQGLFLCGYLSYESGYHFITKQTITKQIIARQSKNTKKSSKKQPLLYFIAFSTLYRPTRQQLDSIFNKNDNALELCAHHFKLNTSKSDYLNTFEKIKAYIESGDVYQINYTLKYRFTLQGTIQQFYSALRHTQPVEFGALLHFPQTKIVSLSPELFVLKKGKELTSKPMKGTAKRGQTAAEDKEIIKAFTADTKTASENVMIVDLIRNDFGKICEIGSVKVNNLFQVETFKSIHQMISTVYGQLKGDISIYEIFSALFPCGSITGAPKIRAMEIIHEIETESRGIYTGAIGYLLPNDQFCFNVPIRTIFMENKDKKTADVTECEMGIGSGIIHQSDAHEEFNECLLKANFLKNINQPFYLIETLRLETKTERYHHIEQHLTRLSNSAVIFGFDLDLKSIKNKLNHYKQNLCRQKNKTSLFKIRLIAYQNGKIAIQHEALLEEKVGDNNKSYRIMLSSFKINSQSIFQYHKTSRREHYNKAYQIAEKKGYYDVVFFNENNELAEASRHNVFIQTGGQYLTPPLSAGILEGIERMQFMRFHFVEEKTLTLTDLINADKILLSNSVRGIINVKLDA